ncbi:Hpt domain-containing protein [Lutimaribacter marinistellae]|uniref:Hpt domain-containing protein n=1 Tax=Lutimaribacter marinistellae TaxID=1820329 RepID=A0ABV7TD48_9RHOB
MIDWSRVTQLRDEVGAEDFEEVVAIFLEEVEEVILRLRSWPDMSLLDKDLHFLKGSALSLGFQSFSNMCQEGERTAAEGKPEHVDIAELANEFERSKMAFLGGITKAP